MFEDMRAASEYDQEEWVTEEVLLPFMVWINLAASV